MGEKKYLLCNNLDLLARMNETPNRSITHQQFCGLMVRDNRWKGWWEKGMCPLAITEPCDRNSKGWCEPE